MCIRNNHSPLAWRSTVWEYHSVQTCFGLTTVNMCQPKPAKFFLQYLINQREIRDLQVSGASTAGVCETLTLSDKATLESVQRCAARWVCGNRWSPVQKHWSATRATLATLNFLVFLWNTVPYDILTSFLQLPIICNCFCSLLCVMQIILYLFRTVFVGEAPSNGLCLLVPPSLEKSNQQKTCSM